MMFRLSGASSAMFPLGVLLLLGVLAVCLSCAGKVAQDGSGGPKGRSTVSVVLSELVQKESDKPFAGDYDVEYSMDGRFLCVWWDSTSASYGPALKIVFDASGSVVTDALESKARFKPEFGRAFPRAGFRTSQGWGSRDPSTRVVKPSLEFADFLGGDVEWAFNGDFSLGLIVSTVDPRSTDYNEGAKVELWRLNPAREKRWTTILAEVGIRMGTAEFFAVNGKRYILVAFEAEPGFVLAADTGEVVDSFTYGHKETESEIEGRRKRLRAPPPLSDRDIAFSAGTFSFDPDRRLLACGAYMDKRVRVVCVDKPHETLFEANADDNPYVAWGFCWRVKQVAFAGGGQYLVVHYELDSMGGHHESVDIFETRSWKRVWSEKSGRISAAISPDGSKIAVVKKGVLEIKPFLPSLPGPQVRNGSPPASGP